MTISIKSRPGLVRPRLESALEFIKNNYSHTATYQKDNYDCKQFAYQLYQDLQAANYESRFVIISLVGEREGHALAAIETSDAGTLYVDFTPFILLTGKQKAVRSVAQVKEGKKYLRIPLENLTAGFRNQSSDFEAFQALLDEGEARIKRHNWQVDELEAHKKQIEKEIDEFQANTKNGVSPREYQRFVEEKENLERSVTQVNEKYDQLILDEQLLRNNSYLDWVGKGWIVKSIKMVP